VIARLLVLLIVTYQRTLSPLLGPTCRFEPSCSSYMRQCLERFGVIRGLGLGLARLSRCHPFHPGGHEPPPPAHRPPSRLAPGEPHA